jgi:hypothetical protein
MNYDWESILKELSRKLINDNNRGWELTPEMLASGWVGNSQASEEAIVKTETRLGTKLPPSYRQFLKISNGWYNSDWTQMRLHSTEEIDWFFTKNQSWINAWQPYTKAIPSLPDEEYFVYGEDQDCVNLRREYLSTALEISTDSGDGDIFLLIPDVVFKDNEWEAWHFGNKLPGAFRYRSFYEMMQKVVEQGCFIV